jgi:hypothetical protein
LQVGSHATVEHQHDERRIIDVPDEGRGWKPEIERMRVVRQRHSVLWMNGTVEPLPE